jgi:hypothetical protein
MAFPQQIAAGSSIDTGWESSLFAAIPLRLNGIETSVYRPSKISWQFLTASTMYVDALFGR